MIAFKLKWLISEHFFNLFKINDLHNAIVFYYRILAIYNDPEEALENVYIFSSVKGHFDLFSSTLLIYVLIFCISLM